MKEAAPLVPDRREFLGLSVDTGIYLLIVCVALAVPVAFSWRTIGSGYVKNVIVAGLVLTGVAMWAVRTVLTREATLTSSPVNIAVCLYWAAAGLSVALSQYPLSSAWAFWRISVFVLLCLLVANVVTSRKRVMFLLGVAAASAIFVSTYACVQKAGYDPFQWSQSGRGRVFSSIGNPNMLAGYLVIMTWLSIGLVLAARAWTTRLLGMASALAGLVPLAMTLSKGAWLAWALGGIVMIACMLWSRALASGRWNRTRKVVLVSCGLAALVVAGIFAPSAARQFGKTFSVSAGVRVVYWRGAWGMFADHPLFGTGIGTFQIVYPTYRPTDFRSARVGYNVTHAHSEYLETLAEQGLVGFAALALLIAVVYWVLLKSMHRADDIRDRRILCALAGALAAVLAHSAVSVILRWSVCPTFFWIVVGLIMSMSSIASNKYPRRPHAVPLARQLRVPLAVLCCALAVCAVWALVLRPFQAEMLLGEGDRFTRRGQWKKAVTAFESAIGINKTLFGAYYRLAGVYYETGDYEKALETLQALRERAPDYVQIHYNTGLVYAALGRWREAGGEFTRSQESGAFPGGAAFNRVLAKLKAGKAGNEGYAKLLEGILLVNPEDKRTWNRLGAWYFARRRLVDAERCFRQAVSVDGEYVPALSNLAGVSYLRDKPAEAVAACKRILAINPGDVTVHLNIGRAYFKLGNKKAAVEHWRAVLAADPDNRAAAKFIQRASSEHY